MNKTLTINLGGIVYNIDEDAYHSLKNYLETVSSFFSKSEGRDDIMADIEARMAEMLNEKLSSPLQVVSSKHVQEIMDVLGKPEDYLDEDEKEEKAYEQASTAERKRSRKLYRDPDNRILGGVISGIGHYFGFDPIILRFLWIIAVIFFGTGIIVYLIFWIIVPKANTTAEKLEMRGEPVNIGTIGKTVEDQAEKIKDRFNEYRNSPNWNNNQWGSKIGNGIERVFQLLLNLGKYFVKFFGKFLGVVLSLGALIGFPLFFALTGDVGNINIKGDNLFFQSFSPIRELIFANGFEEFLAQFGLICITITPLILLFLLGVWLLSSLKAKLRIPALASIGLLILGILATAFVSIKTARDFEDVGTSKVKVGIPTTVIGDTLILESIENHPNFKYNGSSFLDLGFYIDEEANTTYINNVKLDIKKAPSDSAYVEVVKISRGSSSKAASQKASKVNLEYYLDGNTLRFAPYFSFSNEDKFRNQRIEVTLFMPVNTCVYLTQSAGEIIYDLKNTTNTLDSDMLNLYWTMSPLGLQSEEVYSPEENATDENTNKDFEIIKEKKDGKTIIRYRETASTHRKTTLAPKTRTVSTVAFPNIFDFLRV